MRSEQQHNRVVAAAARRRQFAPTAESDPDRAAVRLFHKLIRPQKAASADLARHFVRVLRQLGALRTKRTEGNAAAAITSALSDAEPVVAQLCRQYGIRTSPVLTYQPNGGGAIGSNVSVGWLVNDGLVDTPASAAVDDQRRRLHQLPPLAGLRTEVLFRQMRLAALRARLDPTLDRGGDGGGSLALRTNLYCDYDAITCLAFSELLRIRRTFQVSYDARVESRMRLALEAESSAREALDTVRLRLSEFEAAVAGERESVLKIRMFEEAQRDAVQAKRLTLAESTTTLESQVMLALSIARDMLEHQLTHNEDRLRMERESDGMSATTRELMAGFAAKSLPVCRMLARMQENTFPSDPEWCDYNVALQNYERLIDAERRCVSSSALIVLTHDSTGGNAEQVEGIIRNCHPLSRFSTARLDDVRAALRAEEDRFERLAHTRNIQHKQAHRYNAYGRSMFNYLRWMRCWDIVTGPSWRVECSDEEALAVYRSARAEANVRGTVPKSARAFSLQSVPFEVLPKLVSATLRGGKEAELIHTLVAVLVNGNAGDCPYDNPFEKDALWWNSVPAPEKRGLAFALMAATCPMEEHPAQTATSRG